MKQLGHRQEMTLKKNINPMNIKINEKDAMASSAAVSSFSAKISSSLGFTTRAELELENFG